MNYPESLEDLANNTIKLLDDKIKEYAELFEIDNLDKIIVNYFDNLDEFRKFIYSIRGETNSLPEYAKGTYDKGMINTYIVPDEQLKRQFTASHELFYILYIKYILNNDYSKRIVWYDEGMAQFYSGEKNKLNKDEEFTKFYISVKQYTKQIPNLNELVHGKAFYNEKYNAYDLSYLSIRYLNEILTEDDFKKLMSDFNNIKKDGNTIVNDMFIYYNSMYNIK